VEAAVATRISRPGQLALALLAFVLLVDLAWAVVRGSTAGTEFALVDEPAHLATALLLLLALVAALGRPPALGFVLGALVASVAIDLDHLPQYLGWDGLTEGVPRPYPHSLLTVACLGAAGLLAWGRAGPVALGAAFGVLAHLLRDTATGPGVALLWPATGATVQAPYVVLAAALALAAALVAASPSPKTK
jgi:inner membrane protein